MRGTPRPGDLDRALPPNELLLFPCLHLQGSKCGIYNHRFKVCRSFRCLLLRSLLDGATTLADGQRSVTRIRDAMDEIRRHIGKAALETPSSAGDPRPAVGVSEATERQIQPSGNIWQEIKRFAQAGEAALGLRQFTENNVSFVMEVGVFTALCDRLRPPQSGLEEHAASE